MTSPQQYWHFRDYSKKLAPKFGRFRGFWRVHHMLSEILMMYHDGQAEVAAAMTVQAAKAIYQVGLEGGEWQTANLLWPLQDPMGSDEWAGTAEEMRAAHA